MRTHKNKGFTLVELLVVIAIIGILASVVLVSLNSARSKARDARRISDLHQLSLALENYYDANQAYPAALTSLETTYIAKVPVDPTNSGVYVYGFNSSGCTPANQRFVLRAALENTHTSLSSDVDGTTCTLDCEDGTNKYYCIQP